ncbi:hypothetical protein ACIQPQ_23600 [Streptomyces sp. NPDC091281]|uniref:hypothetical protein n=1 Tax=Streptomyces sp. NPDC091281 TaxID=3365985 RepID=UPI003828AD62
MNGGAGYAAGAGTAIGLSTAAALVNLALWHGPLLAAAHGAAPTALLAGWVLLAWGAAPGALTFLLLTRRRRRTGRTAPDPAPPGVSPTATLASVGAAWAVSALTYAFLTDPTFRHQAMSGPGHGPGPAAGHVHGADPIGLLPLLVPVTYAVVGTAILLSRPAARTGGRSGAEVGLSPPPSGGAPQ